MLTRPIVLFIIVPLAIVLVTAGVAFFGVALEDRGDLLVLGATAALGVMAVTVARQQAKTAEQSAQAANSELELKTLDMAEKHWFRGVIAARLGDLLSPRAGRPITTREEARSSALQEYERDPERWRALAGSEEPWDRYAYDVARRMDHAGVASFMGAASLRTLLALLGSTIAEDWVTAGDHVEAIRANRGEPVDRPVRRRHAEWLGLVALCWAASREPQHQFLSRWAGERYPGGRRDVADRIRLLMAVEPEMIGSQTARELRTLLGIDPFNAANDRPMAWFDAEPSRPQK